MSKIKLNFNILKEVLSEHILLRFSEFGYKLIAITIIIIVDLVGMMLAAVSLALLFYLPYIVLTDLFKRDISELVNIISYAVIVVIELYLFLEIKTINEKVKLRKHLYAQSKYYTDETSGIYDNVINQLNKNGSALSMELVGKMERKELTKEDIKRINKILTPKKYEKYYKL